SIAGSMADHSPATMAAAMRSARSAGTRPSTVATSTTLAAASAVAVVAGAPRRTAWTNTASVDTSAPCRPAPRTAASPPMAPGGRVDQVAGDEAGPVGEPDHVRAVRSCGDRVHDFDRDAAGHRLSDALRAPRPADRRGQVEATDQPHAAIGRQPHRRQGLVEM